MNLTSTVPLVNVAVGTHNNRSYAVVGSRVAAPTAEREGSIVPTVVGKDTTKTVSLCTTVECVGSRRATEPCAPTKVRSYACALRGC
jgi:hypothetical protein